MEVSNNIIDRKFEYWTTQLLDLGKRNKMIKYKPTLRGGLDIIDPDYNVLYKNIVLESKKLTFEKSIKDNASLTTKAGLDLFEKLGSPIYSALGDIKTNGTLSERDKTLKNLRSKANLSLNEQGINTLYLMTGFLEWREKGDGELLRSPLLLTPIEVSIKSISSPYTLSKFDDEVVLNPTISYLFEKDYDLSLPDFNWESENLDNYMDKIEKIVSNRGWKISRESKIGLVSFLKINMYKDLLKNEKKVKNNPIIKSFADSLENPIKIPTKLQNFNHDKQSSIENYEIVNSDSSQQDAMLLAKEGISFVLQGPPGTGKSQTITNIIGQALGDKKKVLFVSEKQAALDVVYRKLQENNLSDFCLPLHSHKANKKDVIAQLENNLYLDTEQTEDNDLFSLSELDKFKEDLSKYAKDIHEDNGEIGISTYEAIGRVSQLVEYPLLKIRKENLSNIKISDYHRIILDLNEYEGHRNKVNKLVEEGYWDGFTPLSISFIEREEIKKNLKDNIEQIALFNLMIEVKRDMKTRLSYYNLKMLLDLDKINKSYNNIPESWIDKDENREIRLSIGKEIRRQNSYKKNKEYIGRYYREDIIDNITKETIKKISSYESTLFKYLKFTLLNNKEYLEKISKDVEELINLIEDLKLLNTEINQIQTKLSTQSKNTLDNSIYINSLSSLEVPSSKIPLAWLDIYSLEEEIDKLYNIKQLLIDADKLEKEVSHLEEVGLSYGRINNIISFLSNYIDIEMINRYNHKDLEYKLSKNKVDFQLLDENWKEFNSKKITAFLDYNIFYPEKYSEIDEFIEIIDIFRQLKDQDKEGEYWKHEDSFLKSIELIAKKQSELNNLEEEVFSSWKTDIINLDGVNMLIRFRTEHKGILKKFKSSYKKDIDEISRLYIADEELTDNRIKTELIKINKLKELYNWFKKNNDFYRKKLGNLYIGIDTDIEKLKVTRGNYLSAYEEIYEKPIYLDLIKNSKVDFNDMEEVRKRLIFIKNLIDNNKEYQIDKENYLSLEISNYRDYIINLSKLYDMVEEFIGVKNEYELLTIKEIITRIDSFETYKNLDKKIDYLISNLDINLIGDNDFNLKNREEVQDVINSLKLLEMIINKTDANENMVKSILNNGFYFNSKFTKEEIENISTVIESSSFNIYDKYNELSDYISMIEEISDAYYGIYTLLSKYDKYSFSEYNKNKRMEDIKIIYNIIAYKEDLYNNKKEYICKYGDNFDYENTDWEKILIDLEDLAQLVKKFESLDINRVQLNEFMSPTNKKLILDLLKNTESIEEIFILFADEEKMWDLDLYNLENRLNGMLNSIDYIDDWIIYRDIRKKIELANLSDFIEGYDSLGMEEGNIAKIFEKSFYIKLVNERIKEKDSLAKFNSLVRQNKIERFIELDKKQFVISQKRIREKLIKDIPSYSTSGELANELSILNHEAGKKSRVMPIRKLFTTIPNLLLTLKPCLMMSPLSVSYYLDSEVYDFDMVIFDEASQIFPEDAIGAISRGKQVIISGDSKQLPPTSFFKSSSDSSEFDNDLEEDDILYDSILEAAAISLPNRSLLWHYRSKNEELISFSNKYIYNNNLVTFPSNQLSSMDNGVEYIYVEDGVYTNRSNKREAEKIVSLVESHIKNCPSRSLGIVAFSEAQQNIIEEAIDDFRFTNREYEYFFDEEIEEPFFVKNLENVQGDERDTIIFSIAYGKNEKGKMYMNFGPLSKQGGERRLNVAITRAKYNIKLVGSILPKDIELNRINSEGGRLLREYIEYAIKPNILRDEELSLRLKEDLLKEKIASSLSQDGFLVDMDIGNSDYKIDMAIRKSKRENVYLLGLELDGESYWKTRTSRDRDRIRSEVLKDMGWTIYRIWSLDWFKEYNAEYDNLKNYILELKEEFN